MNNILGNYQDHCINSFTTDVESNNIVILITDTIHPYIEYRIECKGVIVFSFFRTETDKDPYFCPEFYWRLCDKGELKTLLENLNYPFHNCSDYTFKGDFMGDVITPDGDWIYLHFEGNASGDIVCKYVSKKEIGSVL